MNLYLCDNHLPAFDEISFCDFSLLEWEQYLVKGNVDCLMVYAKDHWGYAYYDTKVGTKHPKLNFDLLAETAAMLVRNNIKLMTYYSVGFDNIAALAHDDWAVRNINGDKHRIFYEKIHRWHSCCFSTGYRDFCLSQLREILSTHIPDFLFLDIIKHGGYTGFGQNNLPLCYCTACQAKFKSQYGMSIPTSKTELQKHRIIIQDWEMNVMDYEVIDAITSLAESYSPSLPVMFNETVHFCSKAKRRMNAHFSEGRYGSWRTAAMSRLTQPPRNYRKSVISCHPTLTSYDIISSAPSALAAAQVAAWDGEPFIMNGPQDAHGRLDKASMMKLPDVFSPLRAMQNYLSNRKAIAEIWVLDSERQKMLDPADHSEPLVTMIDFLTYSKYSFAVVHEEDIAVIDNDKTRILIVPRATWLSNEEVQGIRQFVKAGGTLVCSEDFSLGRCIEPSSVSTLCKGEDFLLSDVMGVNLKRINTQYCDNPWGSYLKCEDHFLWDDTEIKDTTVPLPPPLYEVTLSPGAEAIAYHILPCLPLETDRWVNWFSPPPGREIPEHPAVVLNTFGKGKCVYFSAPYLKQFSEAAERGVLWPSRWLTTLLERLAPAPSIRLMTQYPDYIDATYYCRGNELIVHCLNNTAKTSYNGIALNAGDLYLRGVYAKALSAMMLTSKKALKIVQKDNCQIVRCDDVAIHDIIVVQLAK
jgi:hypothetical protein